MQLNWVTASSDLMTTILSSKMKEQNSSMGKYTAINSIFTRKMRYEEQNLTQLPKAFFVVVVNEITSNKCEIK